MSGSAHPADALEDVKKQAIKAKGEASGMPLLTMERKT